LGLFEIWKSTFSKYKVSFVWVILDWSTEDHIALL
jgi:hypothetical protein